MHCAYELCYIRIISIFNFLIFIHFTNQITLKPSLAQTLKLIFKFTTIKGQINVPLWSCMGHKGWRKVGKTFIMCYTIALKFWDEFNANSVLLYFPRYSSIKMWHLYLKNAEKNNNDNISSWSSFIFSKTFSIQTSCLGTQKNCPFSFLCTPN